MRNLKLSMASVAATASDPPAARSIVSLVRPDLLVYLPVLGALLVMWGSLAAYCFVERKLTLERTASELSATATTLADFNELAQQATGAIVGRSAEARGAAMWRALLRHPMASIWVEKAGVITGGQSPSSDLSSYLVLSETRGDLSVHIAIARSAVLSEWRLFVWQWSLALVAVSVLFVILARSLSRALQQRAAAEGTLRQHDALLNVVTQSASKLLGAPYNEAIGSVLALIGRTVGVRRVHLSQVRLDEQCRPRLTVRNEWCSPGMPPMIHHPLLRDLDMIALTPGEVTPGIVEGTSSFSVEDVDTAWAPLFTLAGMRSFLNITVPVAGAPWGLLSFFDSAKTRRQWSWAELDALKTLAGLVGVAIAREKYLKELADANMIVQNSPTLLYRLRGEPPFRLIYISQNITQFGYDPRQLLEVADWMSVLVHPDDRSKVMDAMSRVLEKGAVAASIEFRMRRGTGTDCWVENRYMPVRAQKDGRLIEIEGIVIDIAERKAAADRIAHLARTDALTGLANRATFIERLGQSFAAARRGAGPFAILYLDLDHFKDVNDTLGHPVGDLLLREVAARLTANTRPADLVARLGGDEFAVLQAELMNVEAAGSLAAKLGRVIAEPCSLAGNEVNIITASIGICPYSPASVSPEAMLAQADLALYRSKELGRNQYHFHSETLDAEVEQHVELAQQLRVALERNELALHYQPQVNVSSGKVVGMEALVRWNHPVHGLIEAHRFIPVAEKSGLIMAVGNWVLDCACRQLKAWQEAGIAPPVLAINLSRSQLKSPRDLVHSVMEVTAKWGIELSNLEFDLTEESLAYATLTRNDALAQLRALGANIAIDDFATQYSSFDYLRSYGVSHLKIAKSYVQHAATDPGCAAILRAILDVARELNVGVIAEGVETDAQLALIAASGPLADAQGNYFSAAVDAARATDLLRAGSIFGSHEDLRVHGSGSSVRIESSTRCLASSQEKGA